jgi:hypothetical protein
VRLVEHDQRPCRPQPADQASEERIVLEGFVVHDYDLADGTRWKDSDAGGPSRSKAVESLDLPGLVRRDRRHDEGTLDRPRGAQRPEDRVPHGRLA